MSGPRVLFYVQHLLGIGHLARASRIASALQAAGFDLTLVTGGTAVDGFPAPDIRHFALAPVIASEGFSGLAQPDGTPVDDAFLARRREQLLAIFAELHPDIVITEAFPFGRRQMRFELLPLLDAIEARADRPMLSASIRDIMQERVKPGRNEETAELVREHFDLVLVHGDERFAKLEETFPLAGSIADRIEYTGLVAGPPPEPTTERFDVLVSAGGGAAGRALVEATAGAARSASRSQQWALITGPNLPQADFDAALRNAPAHLSIYRFRRDFSSLLTGAELSVSQAGYNTVCDILRAGCRSLLVPFAAGGETEQTSRAERLAAMGLASVLTEAELTADSLSSAIQNELSKPRPPSNALDLDGAKKTADALRKRWTTFRK
ncbi:MULTISPECIES: glycosyltransferase family protein [Mesorhizobium]|uniref:Glycosyl transferase n=1 Tax=Mesorhizobium denitrificans TaxID=2294114 RepID=A0A371X424_9HYPH|nr:MULTISPECIES: glycosyltransferase [Mesorhizobium]RFC63973.1 glycosyl transferase [Mesorhizobium denitrificans]